jgi:glycosyltransferase involved in cell wall biosynthesis
MRESGVPRVAFFADSFHEVNGVALTSRSLEEFARARGYPMLSVHTGQGGAWVESGSVARCEVAMSALSFGLEKDLRFDMAFARHLGAVRRAMERFKPDIVHITGPSHIGIAGAIMAWRMKLPMVASWHTNIHEYAGRRLAHVLSWMPGKARERLARWAEDSSLDAAVRFYRLARVTLAPNAELVSMLEQRTGRPCRLMRRGVDANLFHPGRRKRDDGDFVVGYVGRLSPEKSVRRLAPVAEALERAGAGPFRIETAGHGGELDWLVRNVPRLRHRGVLRGELLAEAYAGFDVFAFPSETDTYGNVVQEAMASGVPCVVMASGGPASIVTDGREGFVCSTEARFVESVVKLCLDPRLRREMGGRARRTALESSWDRVFEGVYAAYKEALGAFSPAPVSS